MLKAAVIGIGNMGKNHVRVYAEMETVELVAIADVDEAAMHRTNQSYRIRGSYVDYRRMLDLEHPDVVSVAVPTRYHKEVACEAMERGIHVLLEKPLALVPEEGEAILEAASARGVKLMVGYIERFNPAIIEIKRRLAEEELGRIFQIHARRLSPFPKRIQDVGVVLDLATHDIDVMCYLTGANVGRVYAEIERKVHERCEDLLSGLLRFEDGTIGVLDVNWLTPTTVRQLAVLGERGMYLADYRSQDVYWYQNDCDDARTQHTLNVFRGVWEGDMVKLRLHREEPLRREIRSFIRSVVEDRNPEVGGEDAMKALEVAYRLFESGLRHVPLSLRSMGKA